MISTLFFILTAAIAVLAQNDPLDGAKLILIVETFRHGARNRIYSNGYIATENIPTQDYGELTEVGERMHYVLGQTLRKKYEVLLGFPAPNPKQYDHNFIWAKSTDVNRTIMSGYSQLAGMFPLYNGIDVSAVSPDLLLPPMTDLDKSGLDEYALPQGQQPAPIHVRQEKYEQQLLGYGSTVCANSQDWQNANINGAAWNTTLNLFQDLIDQLVNIPAMKLPQGSNLNVVAQLVDTLITVKWKGKASWGELETIIDGFGFDQDQMNDPKNKNVMWVRMNLLYNIQLHLSLFNTPQQKSTYVTPYLKELLAYFNNSLTATPQQPYFKWIMLSAHDTTIGMVSQAMNFTSWECLQTYIQGTPSEATTCLFTYPGFASSIIYELYQDKNQQPFIRALYNGTAMPLCGTQNLYCYLDQFTYFVNNFVVADYDEECGNLATGSDDDSVPTWCIAVISVIGGLLLISLILLFVMLKKLKNLKSVEKNSAYSNM